MGAESNVAYNPFEKIRKASVYAESECDETQNSNDPEHFVAELVRRGTKKLTFTEHHFSPIVDKESPSTVEKPAIPFFPHQDHQDEEKSFPLDDSQTAEAVAPRSITRKQRAFLLWRRWRRRLAKVGLGDQWEVKPAIADIATATIAFAPLSTRGHHLLPATARPQQTVVIEYENQSQPGQGIVAWRQSQPLPNAHLFLGTSLARSGKVRAPRIRIFSQKGEKDERRGTNFSGLKDLTDEVCRLLRCRRRHTLS